MPPSKFLYPAKHETCHRDDEEEEEDDDEPEFIRAPKKGLLRPSWSTQKSTNGGKYL